MPITMRGAGTSIAGNALGRGCWSTSRGTSTGSRRWTRTRGRSRRCRAPCSTTSTRRRASTGCGSGRTPPRTRGARSAAWWATTRAARTRSPGARPPRTSWRWGSSPRDGVARTSDALGPALDARLRSFVGRHTDLLRAELPPWPRRVSGYALDWLLPERGFAVARALTGTEGTCAVVSSVTLRLVAPPAATRPARARLRGRRRGGDGGPVPAHGRPAHRREPERRAPRGPRRRRRGCRRAAPGCWSRPAARRRPRPATMPRGSRRRSGGGPDRRPRSSSTTRASGRPCGAPARTARAGRRGSPTARRRGPGSRTPPSPSDRLAGYIRELRRLLRDHALEGAIYGHFGEGCLHLRAGFGLDRPGGEDRLERFLSAAADLTVAHGGSLSGEHGDGRARSELLARQFSPAHARRVRRVEGDLGPGRRPQPGRHRPAAAAHRRPAPAAAHDPPARGAGPRVRGGRRRPARGRRAVHRARALRLAPGPRAPVSRRTARRATSGTRPAAGRACSRS